MRSSALTCAAAPSDGAPGTGPPLTPPLTSSPRNLRRLYSHDTLSLSLTYSGSESESTLLRALTAGSAVERLPVLAVVPLEDLLDKLELLVVSLTRIAVDLELFERQ